ncbi:MAG: hypothetical protein J6N21_06635, partial [Butyrivibrio sp.]|nr:hypothetical protein [Butyrivibrio sp.]
EEIFNNGIYVETTKEENLVSGATYTATDIDSEKTYKFYFAAVDRAGNVSDVKETEVKGSAASGGSGSGSGSGAGSGSKTGGLTPAPNGIAGSGTSNNKNKTSGGTSGSQSQSTTKNPLGSKDREISRDPYISDATGSTKIGKNATSGWSKINSEVGKADKGALVEVDMSGTSEVPASLFGALKGRDETVKLKMADGVQWQINGSAITGDISDKDMGVKLGSRNITDKVLTDIADIYPHVEFSTTSTDPLGFEAGIIIPCDKMNTGMNATLYRYDAKKKELVIAGSAVVDENGNATFDISESGDYTVIITPERVLEQADTNAVSGTTTLDSGSVGGSSIQFNDIFAKKGGAATWLFFMAIVSAIMCIAILFAPTFQEKKEDDFSNLM